MFVPYVIIGLDIATLISEICRFGEKFSGDFCTCLPVIYHGVTGSGLPVSRQFLQNILSV